MLKYLLIAKNTLQEYFVYRTNFFFWRLQVFVSFVTFYYLWQAVAQGKSQIGQYSLPGLFSYFVIGYLIRALVFTTRTADIGGDIQNGNLSSLLIKPIGTIKYYFSRDIVDKLFNLIFMVVEFFLILFFFRPPLVFPAPLSAVLFILSTAIAVVIFFFYSLVISFISFWADNAWSSRFLFGVVFVNLFSGQFIPLDLLPSPVFHLLEYTPFPYLYYYPVRFWLGLDTGWVPAIRIVSSLFVLLFFFFLSQALWLKGKQKYQSYGH